MKWMKKIKKFMAFAAALAVAGMLLPPGQAQASGGSTPIGVNSAWIRAKLEYKYEDGITGLSDSILDFAPDWSSKNGWYYYKNPVEPGQKVRFITGVHVPTEWTNDLIGKKFEIVVTVEVSEAAPGDSGWDENAEATYSKSFTLWSSGYQHDEDVWIEEGKTTVRVNEYQLDDSGHEVPYVNDKIITPGQHISKIVEFEIGGRKGANIKLVPEPPVKTVTINGVNVDGKNVAQGTVLTYNITVKNPAPDTRDITIRDTVDSLLVIVDTMGGTIIAPPVNDKGGTIQWVVSVPGKGTATVSFLAKAPDGLSENDSMVIPNTAEADIVGHTLKSNTVLVGLNASALKLAVARATGDPMMLVIYLTGVFGFLAAIFFVIAFCRKKYGEKGR